MTDKFFEHDGLVFRYRDEGMGIPVVFQHGLGGDLQAMFDLLEPPRGVRMIAMDARAHGETRPLGPLEKISIRQTVDDLSALLLRIGVDRAVMAGVSMGAAIALRFTCLHAERVIGLILSRPAWLDQPASPNLAIFSLMAGLIREYGPQEGQLRFCQSTEYIQLLSECPDAAQIFANQFAHPRVAETFEKYDLIPKDVPWTDREAWRSIKVPTLILANQVDPIHPWEMAAEMHRLIPGAEFAEITPKSISIPKHTADYARAVGNFLKKHEGDWTQALKGVRTAES